MRQQDEDLTHHCFNLVVGHRRGEEVALSEFTSQSA